MKVCNICGNTSFAGGPGGRMSSTGLPPRCEKCQSLERHRVYRKVFEELVDESALRELYRVIKDDGFVFLTVPAPLHRAKTTDWGYPKEDQHGHYRLYGADFEEKLVSVLPSAYILSKTGCDDVTETSDVVYFIFRNSLSAAELASRLPATKELGR